MKRYTGRELDTKIQSFLDRKLEQVEYDLPSAR